MENTIQKGSDQPRTKVGLDDERSKTGNKNEKREDKGSITDKVMEEQGKQHEVVRT
jgi:hypothetical protein